jgi:hypothetical protein
MMEAVITSETSVNCNQITRCTVPEESSSEHWEGCGLKGAWRIKALLHLSGAVVEGRQNSRPSGPESNPGPPKIEAGMLNISRNVRWTEG